MTTKITASVFSESVNPVTSFKNRIINGAMVIDQRNAGASFVTGSSAYGIDRWLFQTVGATGTAQQVAGNTGNNKAIKITGAASITTYLVSQRIESVNIYDCASQTVAVSFMLSGSASGSVSVRFLYPTATDNYTTTTEPVAGTTVNFTTTPTQYTVTQSLNTNANKGVWVVFDFGAVGASVTRTLEFTQLEKSSTATSFDYRPYGTELMLCQRYFANLLTAGTDYNIGVTRDSSTATQFVLYAPVTMRATPTLGVPSGFGRIVAYDTGFGITVNAVTSMVLLFTADNRILNIFTGTASYGGQYIYSAYDTIGATTNMTLLSEI